MAEETVILNLQVDQGAAERQLEKIEGLLLDNKKAVSELQAAYKKGTITQEEYVKENIRLQQNIKKEQDQKKVLIKTIDTESNSRNALKKQISDLTKEYDNLNTKTTQGAKRSEELKKQLTSLHEQLAKTNPKPAAEGFGQMASQINIAGTSVADIGAKFTALANPLTAGVALVGALGAAYARSTIGAKDLSFAQNQVSETVTLITNRIAGLISSAEDGEGALTKLFNIGLTGASNTLIGKTLKVTGILDIEETRKQAKELALVQEKLEDLGRLEQELRINASRRIEENQDLLEKIADEQVNINDKVQAANKIEENLLINKKQILDVLGSELKLLQDRSDANINDEKALDALIAKRREIATESAALERGITRINKQQDDLNRKLAEEAALRLKILEIDIREANNPNKPDALTPEKFDFASDADDPAIEASKKRTDQFIVELQMVQTTEEQKRQAYLQTAQYKDELDNLSYNTYMNLLNSTTDLLSATMGEQSAAFKIAASAQTIISTYSAATKSYDSLASIPYVGPALGAAAAAAAIASGLANLARINGVQFAEGGYTGDGGKYEAAGIVHKGEYVVPQSVNYSPAAQPHISALESMRVRGYADGGFVANQSTASVNQALIMANAIKMLPVPEVSVKEVTTVANRIRVRENISRLST